MAHFESLAPRRAAPFALAVAGCVALTAGVVVGQRTAALGAAAFIAALVLALWETKKPVFTWTNGLILFIVVVWFVPIKLYRLPIDLPFGAEIYRLILIALLIVLLVSTVLGRTAVGTGGQAKPLVLLLAIAAASQVLNASELATVAADNPSKGLSSFLTFFIAFVLVCSVIRSERQIDTLLAAMVAGGTIIAGLALAEAVTGYNPFNHLGEWLPGFVEQPREVLELRGGRERVYASAQHPIALGAATTLMIPLALYLASKARALRRWLWLGATLILATSALATVSKTVVVMALTMIVVGVWLRGAAIARFWPVLILLPIVAHVITPGALGGLWKSFFPEEGLVTQLGGRAGEAGSGRLGDFDPAMILWEQSPAVGKGLGALAVSRDDPGLPVAGADPTLPTLVFDNQYLTTFVELGAIGLILIVWFVWGAFLKPGLAARRHRGIRGDRLAACAAAGAAFAASLFVFDTLAFIQCSLLFFIVAALGLRARQLADEHEPRIAAAPRLATRGP